MKRHDRRENLRKLISKTIEIRLSHKKPYSLEVNRQLMSNLIQLSEQRDFLKSYRDQKQVDKNKKEFDNEENKLGNEINKKRQNRKEKLQNESMILHLDYFVSKLSEDKSSEIDLLNLQAINKRIF